MVMKDIWDENLVCETANVSLKRMYDGVLGSEINALCVSRVYDCGVHCTERLYVAMCANTVYFVCIKSPSYNTLIVLFVP